MGTGEKTDGNHKMMLLSQFGKHSSCCSKIPSQSLPHPRATLNLQVRAGLQTESQSLPRIRRSCGPNNHLTALHGDTWAFWTTSVWNSYNVLNFIFIHREKRANQRQQKEFKGGFCLSQDFKRETWRKHFKGILARKSPFVQKAEGRGPLCWSLSKYTILVDKIPMRL